MGAMENTSLNIFNTALVLAHPETATDSDFERVEGVIAHEYFHNWTGNRVTCRDWFQLSLKEGLTVFRDQEFSADMNSHGVKRIDDVALLRRLQFAEDSGPMAHPVRPDNYMEINNFYTVTVYEKGAELIRMQHCLLGPESYRKATDIYFDRHDGEAVTCEDFVQCMKEASNIDLSQFFLWYEQAGTPEITASGTYDESKKSYQLRLKQSQPDTPGQTNKKPLHIPIRLGLVGPNGDDMLDELIELREEEQVFNFENIASKPVPSILRGFSAPIKLSTDLTDDELRFLMVNDNDGFNRWEAGQTYALRAINKLLEDQKNGLSSKVEPGFIDTYSALLDQAASLETDKALLARALSLPDVPIIGQHQEYIDPRGIYEIRETILADILENNADQIEKIYKENRTDAEFKNNFEARSKRSLQNLCLRLLSKTRSESSVHLAKAQYDSANNMTDRVGAIASLADTNSQEREDVFNDFYNRFKSYPLVIDKWFALQATSSLPDTLSNVQQLTRHAAFSLSNPNKVRALIGSFANANQVRFHAADGAGYTFVADKVLELDKLNPQVAARLLGAFKSWRQFDPGRQSLIKAALERIVDAPGISQDVYEISSKSLT